MSERIASIDLDLIDVRSQKHRLEIDIPALAESIMKCGQINPITVKKVGDEYVVISGRRRYSALKYIQENITPEKQVKALVYVKEDLDKLAEELITIDENIMRQNLSDIEFDEAIYRRKQIYEKLYPETKQHVSGGVAKQASKSGSKRKSTPAFAKDAAKKLSVSRRSVEKAVSRAAKASESVKKARAEGLLQSKVDLLVTLDPREQDMLLPLVKTLDIRDTKALIEKTRKLGAKSAVIYHEDEAKEDPALKPLVREAARFLELLKAANSDERVFRGESKHDNLKLFSELQKQMSRFVGLQESQLGYIKAIIRRAEGRKTIPVRKPA